MKVLILLLATVATAFAAINDENCGNTKVTLGRILGGTDAQKGQYPWLASMVLERLGGLYRKHACGCSIIDDQWILAASHCFINSNNPTSYVIRVGLHKGGTKLLDQQDPETREHKVVKIIKHEGFTMLLKIRNDIALVKLADKIDFSSDYVNRICLPTENITTDGAVLTIAGWGDTVNGDFNKPPEVLQHADVEAKPDEYCRKQWGSSMFADGQMMCAESPSSSPCVGDSGGPVLMTDDADGHKIQVGVISFGEQACKGPRPPIFTRVAYYMDWIKSKIAENS